jgi:hypothetical protein
MKKNIHDYERLLRIVSGGFLASLAFWGPKKLGYLSFLVPVATGVVGTCPIYSALNFSTRHEEKNLDNEYFLQQSQSEIAAGHPIVGLA